MPPLAVGTTLWEMLQKADGAGDRSRALSLLRPRSEAKDNPASAKGLPDPRRTKRPESDDPKPRYYQRRALLTAKCPVLGTPGVICQHSLFGSKPVLGSFQSTMQISAERSIAIPTYILGPLPTRPPPKEPTVTPMIRNTTDSKTLPDVWFPWLHAAAVWPD